MKVLVTGGCGYIGSFTARALQAAGHEVVVLDDFSEGHRAAWDGALIECDLLNRAAVHAALAGSSFDGAIHFAARAYVGESVQQPLRYWRCNLVPLIHLCEALDGRPLVLSSTCAVYGLPQAGLLDEQHPLAPVSPYGATKVAAERLLADRAAAGMGGFACLRYFNAAGAAADGRHGEDHRPETHLIPLAIRAALDPTQPLTVFGTDWETADGTCVRDYVHVEDLARAHILALERLASGGASGCWNLGTGRGASVREVIESVQRATGAEVPWRAGARRAGDPPSLVAAADQARRELGWSPQWTDLDALIGSAARWHSQNPGGYAC